MDRALPTICAAALLAAFLSFPPVFGQVTGRSNVNTTESILLQPWQGPYGGVPPWNRVRSEEFVNAFEHAIELARTEIEAIANQTAEPSFENTIVAMERAGETLNRLQAIFGVHASNLNIGPMPDIQKVVMPKLAAHRDSITQNAKLFSPN